MLSKNIALAWCNFKCPTPLKLDLDLTRGTSAEVARGAHYCSALTPLKYAESKFKANLEKQSSKISDILWEKITKRGGEGEGGHTAFKNVSFH